MFRYCRLRNPTKKPPYGSILDPHHPLSRGLVVLSLMNEYGGNTAFDASKIQNHGTLNSGCSWGIEKESGIILNGSSGYIDCGDDDSTLFQTNSFTLISRFILFDNSSSAGLVNRGYESTGGKRYEFMARYDYVSFQIDDDVTKTQLEYTSDPVSEYVPYFMAGIRDVEADELRININGINVASMTDNTGNLGDLNGDSLCYGIVKTSTGDPKNFLNGIIISAHIYNRALSEEEQFYLYNEPYANILTPEYWYFCDFGAVSTTHYSLSIDSQSYTTVFNNIGLFNNKKTLIDSASCSVSGQNVSLEKKSRISISEVSYAISFTDINFLHNKKLPINSTSYYNTFQNTDLYKTSELLINSTSYNTVFQPVNLLKTSKSTINSQNYSAVFKNIDLLKASDLLINSASYAALFNDINLIYSGEGRSIIISPANYNTIFHNISLFHDKKIDVGCSEYLMAFQPVNIILNRKIILEPTSYIITFQPINLLKEAKLTITSQNHSSIFQNIGLLKTSKLLIKPTSYITLFNNINLIYSGIEDKTITITPLTLSSTFQNIYFVYIPIATGFQGNYPATITGIFNQFVDKTATYVSSDSSETIIPIIIEENDATLYNYPPGDTLTVSFLADDIPNPQVQDMLRIDGENWYVFDVDNDGLYSMEWTVTLSRSARRVV